MGTGNSSITVGGTSGLIEIQSGRTGGMDIVNGCQPGVGDPHLVNFSILATSSAISSGKPDGKGGTLLTFPDDTRIDLLGIMKVTSSYFAQSGFGAEKRPPPAYSTVA